MMFMLGVHGVAAGREVDLCRMQVDAFEGTTKFEWYDRRKGASAVSTDLTVRLSVAPESGRGRAERMVVQVETTDGWFRGVGFGEMDWDEWRWDIRVFELHTCRRRFSYRAMTGSPPFPVAHRDWVHFDASVVDGALEGASIMLATHTLSASSVAAVGMSPEP
ncbi:MAG: hypothetical protein H6738_18235 [Alphaproteobacteria bacterium]|nr:hypothetical protein [Alphaproteobacteria bacterium]